MNRIWNIWRMNTSELIWSLIIMLGGTAFGMVIMSITLMLGEESYLVIGSFVALIVWVMVFIFFGVTGFERTFSMAVAMGRTRKEVVICHYIVKLINVWIGLAVLKILNFAETAYYNIFFKSSVCEGNIIEMLLSNWIFIELGILLPVLYMFIGMLLIKFQKKAFWGIWVIWIASSLTLANISYIKESEGVLRYVVQVVEHIGNFVVSIGVYGQLAIVAGVAVVLFFITGTALSKQAVTQV